MTLSPAPEAIKSIAFRGSDSRVEPGRTLVTPAQSDSRRWQADAPGSLPSFSRKAGDADESVGAMFTVTDEDVTQGTGVGFDDPDVGAARRDTLHEVTHALGVLSVVDSDGESALGNQGGFGLFTFFDSMLVRGSTGEPLYLDAGEIDASAEDVTSGDVLFAGDRAAAAFGSFSPVFAPSRFLQGSSIGHWSFKTGADVVMLAAADRGEQRRTFAAWELQALADFGYHVVEEGFPADAGVPDPPIVPPPVPDPPIDPPSSPADPAPDDPPDVTGFDREPVTSPSSESSGGCSVSGTHGGAIWPILFALLATKRRRMKRREQPLG